MGAALSGASDECKYAIGEAALRDYKEVEARLAKRTAQLTENGARVADRIRQASEVAAGTTQQLALLRGGVVKFAAAVEATKAARDAAQAELDQSCAFWRETQEVADAAKKTVLDVHRAVARWEETGGAAREAEQLAKAPGPHPEFSRVAAVAFAAAVEARRWEVAQWLRDHFGDAAVNLKGPMMEGAIADRAPGLARELVARGHVDRGSADYAAAVLGAALDFADLDTAVFLATRGGLARGGVDPLLPRLRAAIAARRAAAAGMTLMENELLEPATAAAVAEAPAPA